LDPTSQESAGDKPKQSWKRVKAARNFTWPPTLSLSFVEVEQGFATSETGGSGDWREDPIVPGDGSDWD